VCAQQPGTLTADIPEQPLAEALAAYTRQTGLQLVYISKIAQGKTSRGAPAGSAPRAALSRLLEGTGLTFEFLNERSVRIFAAPSASSSQPSPSHGSAAQTTEAAEEVVVTAFARRQSADRVPVTVSVWTPEKMEAGGVSRLDELAEQTPGVYFMQASRIGPGIETYLFVRGLNGIPGGGNVGVYIDDVPIYLHCGCSTWGDLLPFTFDLDRVEVLYGPQSTLGGDAAEAGAVRFINRQPSLSGWSGFATSSFAGTEHGAPDYQVGGALGGPVVADMLGFRASVWWQGEGGYVSRVDPFNGAVLEVNSNRTASSSARLAFTLAPDDGVRITPAFLRQTANLHDSPAFYDGLSDPRAGLLLNGKLLRQPSEDTFYLASLTATLDLRWAQLTSITAYTHRVMYTLDDTSNLFGQVIGGWGNPLGHAYPLSYLDEVPSTFNDRWSQASQELRATSSQSDASVNWLLGTWLARSALTESDLTSPLDTKLVGTVAGYSSISSWLTQAAAFGQIDVRITDRLRGSAGVRVSHDQYQNTALQSGALYSGAPSDYSNERSATTAAPSFALTYTPADYGVFYLSLAKGYRLGGINLPPYSGCGQQYSPAYGADNMWSYEAGAKSRTAGGELQLDIAVFHVVFNNIQQVVYPQCGQSYVTNAGAAASDGFDLSMRFDPLARLQVGAAVEYANARYTESITLPTSYSISAGDALGVAPHVAPPWSGSSWIEAILSAPARQPQATVRLSAIVRSHNPGPFYTDDPSGGSYAPGWRSDPATAELSLRAQLSWPSVELSAFVRNLLNAQPLLSHMSDTTRADLYYDETFRPRTYGAAVTVRF
jgi:outer membrane receptor protein involved in Fe transport